MPYFMTDYSRALFNSHWFGSGTWNKPTQIWLGLFLTLPTTALPLGTEVSTTNTGYGRIALAPADANYSAPGPALVGTGRITKNVAQVQFPNPNQTGPDWGKILAIGRYDAQTGGNFEGWFPVDNPFYVLKTHSGPILPINALTFQVP